MADTNDLGALIMKAIQQARILFEDARDRNSISVEQIGEFLGTLMEAQILSLQPIFMKLIATMRESDANAAAVMQKIIDNEHTLTAGLGLALEMIKTQHDQAAPLPEEPQPPTE